MKKNKCCETCENLIAIGEGDHICLEVAAKDGDPATVVISDYSPTDNYFLCGGKKWRMS